MTKSFTGLKRIRKTFGQIGDVAPMPNLIEVQKSSYDRFLQTGVMAPDRTDSGLQEAFKTVFPISDFSGRAQLEFVKYELENPKYDVEECQQRGMTFAAPLKVTLRLVVWDIDEDTGARSIRDIKEQEVYMGDMPLMTANGTFVVNGTERVIVSQMHRSPGVFFDHDKGKTHSSGKYLFAARVIPYRGSWLDFEFDAKDLEPDWDHFEELVWPAKAKRVPIFEKIKLTGGWAGYYDCNKLDNNAVVGKHPKFKNLYLASGFTGRGLMKAPGIGRELTELINTGSYQSIDLSALSVDRVLENKKTPEPYVL